MIIDKILIFDFEEQSANSFEFSKEANIIYSDGNTAGKSCLLKSIYYNLGMALNKFPTGWNVDKMAFKIYYTHNDRSGYIVRSGNIFWVDSQEESLNEKEYSDWLLNTLNINMKLPLRSKEEWNSVYATVPLSLFYIDQDASWNKALYKDTVNSVQMYKANSIPKNVFEYFLDISNDEIRELEEKKMAYNVESTKLSNQVNTLRELESHFVDDSSLVNLSFDESKIKKEIEEYLDMASNLNEKIKQHKSSIYSKKIKIDALKVDNAELKIVLSSLNSEYKDISSSQCPKCSSKLTTEQSIQRMTLDKNRFEIKRYLISNQKNIEKLEKEIDSELNKKLQYENEYKRFMDIANSKQGDLTLNQYIEEKSKEEAKNNYCKVQNDLIIEQDRVASEIKAINSDIKKLQKKSEDRVAEITKFYDESIESVKRIFPKAKFEHKFLQFNQLDGSGAVKNQTFLSLYMVYTSILMKYSNTDLPFVLDSTIKDEVDKPNYQKIYGLIEETVLKSGKQTFFAVIEENTNYIENFSSYHKVALKSGSRLLDKGKYKSLEHEINEIIKPF